MRFALYYTPAPSTLLWQLGCSWLGRDALVDRDIPQVGCPDLPPKIMERLTAQARRYGLHATLKPPFKLHRDAKLKDLQRALQDFVSVQSPFSIGRLRLSQIMGFLCLRPENPPKELGTLASTCVKHFDGYRAALSPTELAQRNLTALKHSEKTNLLRWGYPYVLDEFRFHLTLTDPISDTSTTELLQARLNQHFDAALKAPIRIDAITLCIEPSPGAPFLFLERYLLGDPAALVKDKDPETF